MPGTMAVKKQACGHPQLQLNPLKPMGAVTFDDQVALQ